MVLTRPRYPTVRYLPQRPPVPPGAITGDDWTTNVTDVATAKQELAWLNTQRYDVRGFGLVGTSNDSATFNAAIDWISANGGGILTGPRRWYAFLSGLILKDGVFLEFARGTAFIFTGATVSASACIYGTGTLTALPDLASSVSKDGTTLIFATTPTIAAGDVGLIYNPTNYSFSPAKVEYRDGEFFRVLSLVSATATITRPLYAAHDSAVVDMYKVNPIRTGLSGVRVVGIQNKRAITVDLGTDLAFSDLDLTGSNYSHLELKRCYDVTISRVKAIDFSSATAGLNYGITICNCQSVYLNNVYLETSRHGLTTSGDASVGCVPNRDIRINDSYLGGHSSAQGICGLGLHANIEWAWFTDCTLPNGYMFSGDHVFLDHCDVSAGRTGFCLYPGSPLGMDHHFTRCTFRATKDHAAGYAFLWAYYGDMGLTRTGGTFTFTGNTIDMGPYKAVSGATAGLYLQTHSDGDLPSDNYVYIADNEIKGTAAATGSSFFGITLRARAGRSFRKVTIRDNRGNRGILVNEVDPQYLNLSGNDIQDAPWLGVQVLWSAAPVYTSSLIEIADTTVLRARNAGLWIVGSTALDTTLIMDQVTSLNCNQAGGTATTDASMHVSSMGRFIRRMPVIGDTQAVPTLNRLDSVTSVTYFKDVDPDIYGTVTTRALTSITTHEFHGSGTSAPSLSCANGSTYRQIGTGLHHRKGGAWVAL